MMRRRVGYAVVCMFMQNLPGGPESDVPPDPATGLMVDTSGGTVRR